MKDFLNKDDNKIFIFPNSWGAIGALAFLYSKTFRKIVIGYLIMMTIWVVNILLPSQFHNNNIDEITQWMNMGVIFVTLWSIRKDRKKKKLEKKRIKLEKINVVENNYESDKNSELVSLIESLNELKNKGILTEEEFNFKKKELLAKI